MKMKEEANGGPPKRITTGQGAEEEKDKIVFIWLEYAYKYNYTYIINIIKGVNMPALQIYIPNKEWGEKLKEAAEKAGFASVSAYVRKLVEEDK